MRALFLSVPHSGEKVPAETTWLHHLPEQLLMFDVDRYVDRLYRPAVETLDLPWVVAEWHRYVVDLNRLPDDVDAGSVLGAPHSVGQFNQGFHWVKTTGGFELMKSPISEALHRQLESKYFWPFHHQVESLYKKFREAGAKKIYHIDAHSMPSRGTSAHRDPGEERADIVVSDFHGKSCETWFRHLVVNSYQEAGFKVAVNWPYIGGRVTQTYGQPDRGQHAIQVELKRSLYMDENSKTLRDETEEEVQAKLTFAIQKIHSQLPEI